MLLSDRVTGGAVALLGAAAAIAGYRLPAVPGQEIGPSVFPTLIGIGLLGCGTMIALGVGRSFEEEAEADLAASEGVRDGIAPDETSPLGNLRALLPPALLIFYVLAVDRLGFVPTAAVMVVTMVGAFGGKWRLALALGIVGPVLIHLVFFKLLRVPLPAGLLPMPW